MQVKTLTAKELLEAHRNATIARGDIVRTIVALDERLSELEARHEYLSDKVWDRGEE